MTRERDHAGFGRIGSAVQLGPVTLPDGVLTLRSPTLADGPAWSRARLANRQWLERAFPAWGDDWAAEQSEAAWVRRFWHLRRAAARNLAKPLVVVLDGELIGEIGIDAVDEVSGGGEASVWMVREHGSTAVMGAASLLLILHAFRDQPPLDRIVSPVATSSRAGRSPGLTAAGLRIEATVPRRVGDRMLDHDMWVVHNNAATRGRVAELLARFPTSDATPDTPRRRPAAAMAGAVVRASVRVAWQRRVKVRADASRSTKDAGDGVIVRLDDSAGAGAGAGGWTELVVERKGLRAGTLRFKDDAGTGILEIMVAVEPATDRGAIKSALRWLLASVERGGYAAAQAAVRVPTGADPHTVPDGDMLSELGLSPAATFAGNPDGPRAWRGEQWWMRTP